MKEWEFTLRDGSKRYEFAETNSEMHQLRKMHKAISVQVVDKGKSYSEQEADQ